MGTSREACPFSLSRDQERERNMGKKGSIAFSGFSGRTIGKMLQKATGGGAMKAASSPSKKVGKKK